MILCHLITHRSRETANLAANGLNQTTTKASPLTQQALPHMSQRFINAAWLIENLTDAQRLVLICLADGANDQGVCWYSVPTIAKKVRRSDRTVQRTIRHLEDLGHVVRATRYRLNQSHTSNVYDVTPLVSPGCHHPPGDTQMSPPPRHSDVTTPPTHGCHPPDDTQMSPPDPHITKGSDPHIINNPPSPPPGGITWRYFLQLIRARYKPHRLLKDNDLMKLVKTCTGRSVDNFLTAHMNRGGAYLEDIELALERGELVLRSNGEMTKDQMMRSVELLLKGEN